jgi:hypothetical protein
LAKPASKTSAASKSGTSVSPVTEDEIRSVLLAVAPVTTQDLVSRFKSRLRGAEVRLFDTILFFSCGLLFTTLQNEIHTRIISEKLRLFTIYHVYHNYALLF